MFTKAGVGTFLVLAVSVVVVMYPRVLSPGFSLLDDGVVLRGASKVGRGLRRCDVSPLLALEKNGRFRPVKWSFMALAQAAVGNSPRGFHLFFGLTWLVSAFALAAAIRIVLKDRVAGLLAGVAFVFCPPAVENYYTISKDEPALVLWLSLSIVILACALSGTSRKSAVRFGYLGASAGCVGLAYFTKETAQILGVVSIAWVLLALVAQRRGGSSAASDGSVRTLCWYAFGCWFWIPVYWATRSWVGIVGVEEGRYSSRYGLDVERLFSSLAQQVVWVLRDFPFLIPITAYLLIRWIVLPSERWSRFSAVVVACGIWMMAWGGIYLPWGGKAGYYHLPGALGVSALVGLGVATAVRDLRHPSPALRSLVGLSLFSVFLLLPSVLNGVANGRVQIAMDRSASAVLKFVATEVSQNGVVVVNLPRRHESVVQMRRLLTMIYGRSDIEVASIEDYSDVAPEIVLSPTLRNRPRFSVRIGVPEGFSARFRNRFDRDFRKAPRLIAREKSDAFVQYFNAEMALCWIPGLRSDRRLQGLCSSGRRFLGAQTFEYGWDIFRVE